MRYYVIDQFTQRVMYATNSVSGIILNGSFVVPVPDDISINEDNLSLGFTQPNTIVGGGLIDQIQKGAWYRVFPHDSYTNIGFASTYMFPFLSSSAIDMANSAKVNIGKNGTITIRHGGVLVTNARDFIWAESGETRTISPLYCMGRWVRSESNKNSVTGANVTEYTTSQVGPVKFWRQFDGSTSDYWCTVRVSVNGGSDYTTLSGSDRPAVIPIEEDGNALVVKIENNTSTDISLNWLTLVAQ